MGDNLKEELRKNLVERMGELQHSISHGIGNGWASYTLRYSGAIDIVHSLADTCMGQSDDDANDNGVIHSKTH